MSSKMDIDTQSPALESAELAIPSVADLPTSIQQVIPKHVAIIMDGNGRWAEAQGKARVLGHRAGVKAVRRTVTAARQLNIQSLTLFAFSSENWRRPDKEVSLLMELFFTVLQRELKLLDKNGVRLNIIGDISRFSERLQKQIREAEAKTAHNRGLILNVAANYGGRWDMMQAAKHLAQQVAQGQLSAEDITEDSITEQLSMAAQGEVDLMIRTGGDYRISNFILWQAAYAELVFTDTLWPDFDEQAFHQAVHTFASRQRRFGLTGNQIETLKAL